ncbi:MAG: PQQ-binding-like beta-propeller repeat protein [Burkholderiales bacterium]|nr:PQQ-binding-like beta-propeller repeat protein [Burkholderiales bacterium]
MIRSLSRKWRCIAPLMLALVATAALADGGWSTAGHDLANTRNQPGETQINTTTVAALTPQWTFTVAGDVTANPAVDDDGAIYFPDSAGFLYKVNPDGTQAWKVAVGAVTGIAHDYVRATPAIAGNALIMGNQSGKNNEYFGNPVPAQGAWVFAVDKRTGAKLWLTQIDAAKRSMVTHSAIVAKGLAYVGVASNDELVAGLVTRAAPGNFQWQGRGSMVALDVATGAIRWKTYMVPEGGYYGGSIWGSTGAVDLKRNQLYVATGDNFWVPESVQQCAAAALAAGKSPTGCFAADDYFDAIVALDLDTGKVNWAQHGIPYDVWNVGCGLVIPGVFTIPPNDNCPNPKGPDYDFAQGPILMVDSAGVGDNDIVGAGQKSGMFWAFKAKNGAPAWHTQVAPGGLTGGLQWGSAYDGQRIYVAVAQAGPNGGGQPPVQPWTLKTNPPSTTTAGGWAALDPKHGDVLWTTPDPNGSRSEGAVSVANGVVFGCSLNYNPHADNYFALDAATGAIKWSFVGGAACSAGPSISNGHVYWGIGTFAGTGNKRVYGFGLP